jgi:hypothetical protein
MHLFTGTNCRYFLFCLPSSLLVRYSQSQIISSDDVRFCRFSLLSMFIFELVSVMDSQCCMSSLLKMLNVEYSLLLYLTLKMLYMLNAEDVHDSSCWRFSMLLMVNVKLIIVSDCQCYTTCSWSVLVNVSIFIAVDGRCCTCSLFLMVNDTHVHYLWWSIL